MNKSKKIFASLISVLLCLFSASCSSCSKDFDTADFYYFNTEIHVEVDGKELAKETIDEIDEKLNLLHTVYKLNDKNGSFTAQFNAMPGGESMVVTKREANLLNKCKEYYFLTEGKFNPAVYPLLKLWQFAPSYPVANFTPPTDYDCEQIIYSEVTDFENGVLIDGNKVTKPLGDTQIDLGGIVKGLAADEIGKMLKDGGYAKGYVSVGGSSLYILETQGLGITHPRQNGEIINVDTPLKNLSVSTSGDYQKYYEYQGKRYSHIISGYYGKPADTGVQSATVICPDGTFAEALSTALCLCEYNGDKNDELCLLIKKIIQKYPSSSVYVVVENSSGKTIVTNKTINADFTLLDTSYKVVKI